MNKEYGRNEKTTLGVMAIAMNEADTCRELITPRIKEAGWKGDQICEQWSFTDGQIRVAGSKVFRTRQKRADYLLRHKRDFMIAVVEAKAEDHTPGDGLQQAMDYAQILGLKFAYSTNGHGIIEHDFLTGKETVMDAFPSPESLWQRLADYENIANSVQDKLLMPYNLSSGRKPRYYQQIAINRAVQAVLQGKRRILLTLATGTGKTDIAFQICWKLWESRWNKAGEYRKPRILFLADRNILVDDPKDKTFTPFGDARHKIEDGDANKAREMYFSTYQAIARDERRPGLYREYSQDFFDLIVVDECHRGSARDDSNWREILEYFQPAYQIGMTATPLRLDNKDTYAYFGNPIYTYSLRQGIQDGFLAPYKVHRVVTAIDATGWRPEKGELDLKGQEIPDELYLTRDFERVLCHKGRTEAIARHLTEYLKHTNRFDKTIVFCVDQEHADQMRQALVTLNTDLVKQYPDYVCRVVSDEGDIGRGHLSNFQELEKDTPVILTTSQMLTTGVDAPTCKNVVIFRVINSMTEFKQIIGRGTRVREDYGKLYFTILDYTGSATRLFADPDFDGEPALIIEEHIDDQGSSVQYEVISDGSSSISESEQYEYMITDPGGGHITSSNGEDDGPRKYYVDGGQVEILADVVYQLSADGKRQQIIKYTDYSAGQIKELYSSVDELTAKWSSSEERKIIIETLEEHGVLLDQLVQAANQTEADPLDLLCYLAFNAPLLTRRERAERLTKQKADFFDQYGPKAREILMALVDKYAEYGVSQLDVQAIRVPPISECGTIIEIAEFFGGADQLRNAIANLQTLLYAS